MKELSILFQLKSAYSVNSFLYHLRSVPIVKKYVAGWQELSGAFKIIVMIFVVLKELFLMFVGKISYLFFMIILPLILFEDGAVIENMLVHVFMCLTLIGSFMNTSLFNPTKDRYYAICLMRMDAKKSVLSEYLFFCLKIVIGYLPIMAISSPIMHVSFWLLMSLPFLQIALKTIMNALTLLRYQKTGRIRNENATHQPLMWVMTVLLLGAAYIPLLFNVMLTQTMYWILFGVSVVLGMLSFVYLFRFQDYAGIYKQLLKPENIIFDASAYSKNTMKKSASKQIQMNEVHTSKTGVAYFNEVFIQRHASILMRSAYRISLAVVAVTGLLAIALWLFVEMHGIVNEWILNYLPFFVFVMYFINRGQQITQTMFINCDNAMLHYRFYRQPKFILALFTQRLITLVRINLIPALCIAFGLVFLLWLSGGSSLGNYVLILASILSMSVFYSVHYLVMYYLLQPFNEQVEMKSVAYQIVIGLTYFVAYQFMQLPMSLPVFGSCMILFAIVYVLVAVLLAYKQAPKTFRLK